MLHSLSPSWRRQLSLVQFRQLQSALQAMKPFADEDSLWLTEEPLTATMRAGLAVDYFALMVSSGFSACLSAIATDSHEEVATGSANPDREAARYTVDLTFDAVTISTFLEQLQQATSHHATLLADLQRASQQLQTNDPALQSEFTFRIVETLAIGEELPNRQLLNSTEPIVSVCQPIEDALQQRIQQKHLVNQVTSQIHQSLELPVILQTAVDQVRQLLEADRLVIYQFDRPIPLEVSSPTEQTTAGTERHPQPLVNDPTVPNPLPDPDTLTDLVGRITYEARASESVTSVLNLSERDRCFTDERDRWRPFLQGQCLAVENCEVTYTYSPCLRSLMQRANVQSKLAAPIQVNQALWGLLIAHQCHEPRCWQESECDFLQQIAEHLAIAIYQAQLYAQVQKQKQTLEQRVIHRTQELHDTLLAAQAANRAKSEFLATMSHELRTPLTCIIGMSTTLLNWGGSGKSDAKRLIPPEKRLIPLEKQQSYLRTIHDSGQHLLELINDILDLSQVEAGKTVLSMSEFSLVDLARQSLKTLREKAYRNGVDLNLEVKLSPGCDRFVADQRRLKQILFNLLGNAIKFTPKGGKVTLVVWQEDAKAVFQVEDTGIGIADHQKPLLFEKFQQLDASYHRQYEGTGLGLALTKQLVELHGGRIEVESTEGVGSVFTVWIPTQTLSASPVEPSSSSSNPDVPFEGNLVLIEDREDTATFICDILTAVGLQVVWLMDGRTALDQVELLQPQLAIVDLRLPDTDGYEIIRAMREDLELPELKILVLTAQTMMEVRKRCLEAGADDYLAKPLQPYELLDKVAHLLADDRLPAV